MSAQDDGEPIADPRRALGRRPGAQPSRLQIEHGPYDLVPPSPTFNPPASPRTRHVSLSIPSPNIEVTPPSPSSPSSSPNVRKFRRPTIGRVKQPQKLSLRGLYETQKLLSHLLDKLEAREAAPDLLDRAAIAAREVSGRTSRKGKGKTVVKIGQTIAAAAHTGLSVAQGNAATHQASYQGIGSEDVEDQVRLDEGDWDTEATYDLVDHTRGLLVLAHNQGLDLFASDSEVRGTSTSPIVRPTKRKTGRFSSFATPVSPQKQTFDDIGSPLSSPGSTISGRTLLDRLLSVLTVLINVDCLHRIQQFRLLRPPNALQAACLDIASYLYDRCNSGVKVQVIEMIIGGYYTMGSAMFGRICEWVEGRLGELLERLTGERGGQDKSAHENPWQDPFAPLERKTTTLPMFAISSDTPDEIAYPASSPGWLRYSSTSPTHPFSHHNELAGVLSIAGSTTKLAPLYLQLASLIPRLLLAVSTTIDLSPSGLNTIHRLHRLLTLVFTAKPDAVLDLLDLVAHAPSQTRRSAVELISTFFPESVGHNAISRRPALSTYSALRIKWETGQDIILGEDVEEEHHFIPWRVSSRDCDVSGEGNCSTCGTDIHGFGIKCTLCQDLRHLHCYSHTGKSQGYHYEVVTVAAHEIPTYVVNVKFSLAMTRMQEKTLDGVSREDNGFSTRRHIGQHELHLVNLFTTALCEQCHLPLWGLRAQAYACTNGCQRFYHPACADGLSEKGRECRYGRDVMVDEIAAQGRNPFTITLDTLKSSFLQEYGYLCVETDHLSQRSYDEVAVLYGALWSQYQLLKNGLASGSIRPSHFGDRKLDSDIVELRPFLKAYEEYLRTNETHASSAAADFGHLENNGQVLGQGYLYSDRYLTYVTALLRSPSVPDPADSPEPSEGHLTASGLPASRHGHGDVAQQHETYEMLNLGSLSRSLAQDLGINEPHIVSLFLEQLQSTGHICVQGFDPIRAKDISASFRWCSFGLPLLIDSSPTVETLILAIEALLDDLDLTMNEIGLRLLATRAWPSLLCSPYALERLGAALIRWVMAEDLALHEIVKQFASKHKRLPGVRAGSRGNSSVQIYKEDRLSLQERYARSWLLALHNQDPALYGHVVYEQCKRQDHLSNRNSVAEDEIASQLAASALEHMSTMFDAGLIYSVHLDLLTAWLEDLGSLASQDMIYRSLPRLLRHSITSKQQVEDDDSQGIWQFAQMTMTEGQEGIARVCKWLRVLAFSGVEIPWAMLTAIIDTSTHSHRNLDSTLDLVIAVNANAAWIDPTDFAKLCCKMFVDVVTFSISGPSAPLESSLDVMKQSMLLVLRAFGVSIAEIRDSSLSNPDKETKQPASLSKKRRANTASLLLLPVDEAVIQALAKLIPSKLFPTEMVLDFMWLLFTKSSTAANIDAFLHKHCHLLYPALWDLIDEPTVDRKARSRIYLRLLSVNPVPMELIVKAQFHSGNRTNLRERLLIFVLELADDALTQDILSWRRASVGLVVLFFETLLDHTDIGPDSLVIVRSILPTQLVAISGCFEEFLVRSSDVQRLSLMPRLHRLHLLRPAWPVLSWRVLEDLLIEVSDGISHMKPARKSVTVSALLDAVTVRANLLALGLNMIASGVEIPWITAQHFQQHIGRAVAVPWDQPYAPLTTLILPALRSVTDSTHRLSIGPLTLDGKAKKTALVGALFVPIVVEFGRELLLHDETVQRKILDILHAVFFKQNTRTVELAALGALQSVAEVVKDGENVENRLLALQILHTAVNRVAKDSLVRAVPIIFGILSSVLVSEMHKEGDPLLVEQCRVWLRLAVKMFGRSRLFVQILKNDAVNASSKMDRTVLGRALHILRISERPGLEGETKMSVVDLAIFDLPDVLKRGRQVVEHVLEAFERFSQQLEGEISEDASVAFGSFVNRLGKHVAEWHADEFDPNPVLRAAANILYLAPRENAVMLLHQVSTFLHLCLTRFAVSFDTIVALLRSSEEVSKSNSTENTIRTVLFELAGSALHGQYVSPSTVETLLRYLTVQAFPDISEAPNGQVPIQQRRVLSDSAAGCVAILLRQHPALISSSIDPNLLLKIFGEAGTLLISAEMAGSGTLAHHVSTITSEAAIVQVGVVIPILLASLDVDMTHARRRLIALYPILARATSLCLRASADLLVVQDVEGRGAENLSVVYALFRLALLASRNASDVGCRPRNGHGEGGEGVESLWTRIWPDWFRLLSLSTDSTCINGPLRSIAHTVFLDTIIFLGSIQSTLLVRHAGSINHALTVLHKHQNTTGHGVGKMIKAEAAVRDAGVGGAQMDWEGIKKTIRADLLAAERLRALRSAP